MLIKGDTRSLDNGTYNPIIVVSIFFSIIPIQNPNMTVGNTGPLGLAVLGARGGFEGPGV